MNNAKGRLVASCLLLAGCVSVRRPSRAPEPTSPDNGGMILSVAIKEGRFKKHYARYINVRRLDPRGRFEDQLIASNYFYDDLVYVLDLPPGRYAPVSGAYLYNGLKKSFSFELKVSSAATATVAGGGLTFAGDLTAKIPRSGRERTAELVSQDRGREAELSALTAAKKALAGTLWSDGVERQRMLIGAPNTPVLDVKHRLVPPTPLLRFTFTDALGWGKPLKIIGGLEWHGPQDHARIALTFLSPAMEDFKTKEQYLEYMRTVGSPEDDHRVSEVVFSAHPAYQVSYTTYFYPKGNLVGSLVKVYKTQTLMVPGAEGLYFLHYRAEKDSYDRFFGDFQRFRETIRLNDSPKKP